MVVSQTVELATKDNRWDGPTPFTVQAQKVERGNTSERYTACVADSGTCHGPTPGVNLPLSAVQAHNGRGGMACGCAEEVGTPGQRRSLGWTYPFSLHRHRRGMGQDYHCPLFYCTSTEGTGNQRQPLPPFHCTKHRWGGQARPRNQRPPPLPPFNWSNTGRVDGQDLWLHWRQRNSQHQKQPQWWTTLSCKAAVWNTLLSDLLSKY